MGKIVLRGATQHASSEFSLQNVVVPAKGILMFRCASEILFQQYLERVVVPTQGINLFRGASRVDFFNDFLEHFFVRDKGIIKCRVLLNPIFNAAACCLL